MNKLDNSFSGKPKRKIVFVVMLLAIFSGAFQNHFVESIILDSDKKERKIISNHKKLNDFFGTQIFLDFKSNYQLTNENIDLGNLTVDDESYKENMTISYQIPVKKNDVLNGYLLVYSKGVKSNMLYEDRSKIKDDGTITVTTSQYLVAILDAKEVEDGSGNYMIKVKSVPKERIQIGTRTSQEVTLSSLFKTANACTELGADCGDWWSCTAQCYSYADDACEDDNDCNILCILNWCDMAIAAACAGYCL